MERLVFLVAVVTSFFVSDILAQTKLVSPEYVSFDDLATHDAPNASYQAFVRQVGGNCNTVCASPPVVDQRQLTVRGGYEFGWLQPRFSENVSAVVSRTAGDQAYAFDHTFENTPRVWLGLENENCTGIRARYWQIDTRAATQVLFPQVGATPISLTMTGAGGNLSRTAVANVGEAMTSNHFLELKTIDLEGTQRIRFTRTEVLGAFGLRYVNTFQRAHAVATDGGGNVTELVCQDLDFDGFGPTASVGVRRGLFAAEHVAAKLSFYADTRGSILLGQQEQEIVLTTGGGATTVTDSYVSDSLLPIMEIAGGLELMTQPLGKCVWTVRTGYRAESWFNTGGPVDSDSNLGLHGVTLSLAGCW